MSSFSDSCDGGRKGGGMKEEGKEDPEGGKKREGEYHAIIVYKSKGQASMCMQKNVHK